MTAKTINLGRTLKQGEHALDVMTGFPVIVRDVTEGAYVRYCEFFGFNHGFSGVYARNLKPITPEECRALMGKRLLAPGFYFQPFTQRYWGVFDKTGAMVCMTVYKKGAVEVVKRLKLLAETCQAAIRCLSYVNGSDSSKAKKMIDVINQALEQTEGLNGKA